MFYACGCHSGAPLHVRFVLRFSKERVCILFLAVVSSACKVRISCTSLISLSVFPTLCLLKKKQR